MITASLTRSCLLSLQFFAWCLHDRRPLVNNCCNNKWIGALTLSELKTLGKGPGVAGGGGELEEFLLGHGEPMCLGSFQGGVPDSYI